MISVKLITVGNLKEAYLRDAAAEYSKRLGGFCKFSLVELKEEKLPDDPSEKEIANALSREAEKILAEMPKRAYKIALCVEGKQMSSEELADKVESVISGGKSEICFIIGGFDGLDESIKALCDLRLSFAKMTFPHRLMRVFLLEQIYRAYQINDGTRYHK